MIMSATNFKTVNQTYRQLISNGTYSIPRFQRDYSWTDRGGSGNLNNTYK